jgi:hypothetical protein
MASASAGTFQLLPPRDPRDAPLQRLIPLCFFSGCDYAVGGAAQSMKMKIVFI